MTPSIEAALDKAATALPPSVSRRPNIHRPLFEVCERLLSRGFNRMQAVEWMIEDGLVAPEHKKRVYASMGRYQRAAEKRAALAAKSE